VTELYITGTVAVVILGYIVSLKINPWVKCSRCGGNPKKTGSVFGYAHHFCPKCKGTGQQPRLGSRLFFGPRK
jgi:DnaJ-class molecular chaperone